MTENVTNTIDIDSLLFEVMDRTQLNKWYEKGIINSEKWSKWQEMMTHF